MNTKKLNIGLFGYGNVGRGLAEVLDKAPSTRAQISKIVVKNHDKDRGKSPAAISHNPDDILENPDINIVVELIDDDRRAYEITKKALEKGKNVVSGNKKMIANHLEELIDLQKETQKSLLYDASACGSIPVIRNLEEYYDNDLLQSITGILNGSSNFILTQMQTHGKKYNEALTEAQNKGFAESDPSFDVNGDDALYKIIILTLHGFGIIVKPQNIFYSGISNISDADIQKAREKGKKIKLIARAIKTSGNQLAIFVIPAFVGKNSFLYNVDNEFNGVIIKGDAYGDQLMFGKGAGGQPTGSAVLSDITALSHAYKYEYKKRTYFELPQHSNDTELTVYFRYDHPHITESLPLKSVIEQYASNNHYYTVGTVNLTDLIKTKRKIREQNVFVALYNL